LNDCEEPPVAKAMTVAQSPTPRIERNIPQRIKIHSKPLCWLPMKQLPNPQHGQTDCGNEKALYMVQTTVHKGRRRCKR